MENAVGLSILGAVLALDQAMVGQFMFSQPLIVGALFGWLLGDVSSGLLAGAMVQLIWIGVLPVGAYVPADHSITGGITAGYAVFFLKATSLAFAPSLMLALALAIPAGVLSGKMDIVVRHLNSRIASMGEKVVETRGPIGVDLLNLAGLIGAFVRNFIVYFLWLGPFAFVALQVPAHMPSAVIRGMQAAYWALPILSFAVILEMIAKDRSRWLLVVCFVLAGVSGLVFPQQATTVFAGVLVLGAFAAWRRRSW